LSATLDRIRATRHGVEQPDEPTPEEVEAQRAAAEQHAFDRMEDRGKLEAETDRW
jgi:hypothetical protein